ncbi:hypothetical protein A2U01_0043134, partial [Trifolium medium]|nr:hypothetical protein [Trifolium medium]
MRERLGVSTENSSMRVRDVLEWECSKLSDVDWNGMNWSNRLWVLLKEKLLDWVFDVGTPLRP